MAKAKQKKVAKKSGAAKTSAKKAAPAKKSASAKKTTPAKKSAAVSKKAAPAKAQSAAGKAPAAKVASGNRSGSEKVNWQNFVTPLDDRLIIELVEAERMTPGGLYLPDTATDTSGNFKGTVLVAGRGHLDKKGRVKPMDVKAGDTILFSEYSGSKINLMGKDLRIIRESEVLGIVETK